MRDQYDNRVEKMLFLQEELVINTKRGKWDKITTNFNKRFDKEHKKEYLQVFFNRNKSILSNGKPETAPAPAKKIKTAKKSPVSKSDIPAPLPYKGGKVEVLGGGKLAELRNDDKYIELSRMIEKLNRDLEIANMKIELMYEKVNLDSIEKYILDDNRYIEHQEFHTRIFDTKKDRSTILEAITIIREVLKL